MRTPSLRARTTSAGLTVITVLLLSFDAFVYFTLRANLEETLRQVLHDRATTAEGLADLPPDELASRLTAAGIPADVRRPDGTTIEARPATVRAGQAPPVAAQGVIPPIVSQTVGLPDGGDVVVYATRAGVENTLRRLLLVLALGTAAALTIALALLRRAAAYALSPLDQVVRTARLTTEGRLGERLTPDDPETELGRMATAYDQMLDALEGAIAEARASDERSQRFLADAAHQLRTPIAGVRASVETLLVEEDPAVRDRLLGNLLRETARSSRIVASLLHLARMDRGRPLQVAEVDLAALCADEVERARDLAPHLTVDIHLRTPDATILGDAPELKEALGNILDNARRHARERIDVSIVRDGTDALITVADDGPGVAPEAQRLIFERFATLDGKGGSGLGLPIARGVARAHGGDVTYADGTFSIRLPVADARPASAPSPD